VSGFHGPIFTLFVTARAAVAGGGNGSNAAIDLTSLWLLQRVSGYCNVPPLAIIHSLSRGMSNNTREILGRRNMRRLAWLFVATAAVSAVALSPTKADAGCYRLGETGYHWYRFCFGPAFLYPHHRACRHGYCWYR
jgi:hypothetical protein